MINIENVTCDARDLANCFHMTPRNVLHLVDYGMPVFERGKAGKGHVFKVPWSLHWFIGWQACKKWRVDPPDTLETVLVGYGLNCDYPGFTFAAWMRDARKLARDMGYSDAAFDKALVLLIQQKLLRL